MRINEHTTGSHSDSYEAVRVGGFKSDVADFVAEHKVWDVIDPYEDIVDDLYEYAHPDALDDIEGRTQFANEMRHDDNNYGEWFYFPWSGNVVRYPEETDFYNLRTSRNRNLITHKEQQQLHDARVAVFGLSVGSNVVESLVQHGVGREYLLADFDTLSVANTNRVRATMGQVGLAKTVIVGRKLSEMNPYMRQTHCLDGFNDGAVVDLHAFQPNVIIEEMDNLEAKLSVRKHASSLGVPVVMASDIGERAIIEVERYDKDIDTPPFHGRLSKKVHGKLINGESITQKEREQSLIRINKLRNLSSRLVSSAMEIGHEVGGMPQLGATATIGGALATMAVQEVLLDRRLATGSYVADSRDILRGESPDTFADKMVTLRQYMNRRKAL